MRQRCHKRSFHHPFESIELVAVDGELVILCQSPKLLLVLNDDTVDGILRSFFSVDGFSPAQIGLTFFGNDLPGHFQPDLSIDAAMSTPVMLVIVVEDHDVVAKKFRRMGPGMGNERLFLRECQMQGFFEEGCERYRKNEPLAIL